MTNNDIPRHSYLAEVLYERKLTETQYHFNARMRAKEMQVETINGVEFTIYSFSDGSKLVVSNHGYVGIQTPAQGG